MIKVDCGKDLHNSTDLVKIIEFIFKIGGLWACKLYLNVTGEKLNPSNFYLYLIGYIYPRYSIILTFLTKTLNLFSIPCSFYIFLVTNLPYSF